MSKNSFESFRDWVELSKQDIRERVEYKKPYVGTHVESKLSAKRLAIRMELEEGEEDEVVQEFVSNGGIINDNIDDSFFIETQHGSFFIKKCFVRESELFS